jgi:predicted nucleic acid-binding protein
LDTGPLVAALDRGDAYHGWVSEQLKQLGAPLLTCESVISEATFLLAGTEGALLEIKRLVESGVVQIGFALAQEAEPARLLELMHRYRSVPMSFADACLVRMSELHADASVFTLDGDFVIYRRHRRQKIPLIHPAGATRETTPRSRRGRR